MPISHTSFTIPVILSGGNGTRLWPKSRKAFPKQLHKLYGDFTMLQHTYNRVSHLNSPIVVCNEAQRFMVADQLSAVCNTKPTILLEPVGRNTAPAIAVAALQALKWSEEAVIVVLAADHQIKHVNEFRKVLDLALEKAKEGKLVAFGVVPTCPEVGYGYINSEVVGAHGGEIKNFVEKPDVQVAQRYVASGEYFWNSGMFVFKARTYVDELNNYEPDMLAACEKALECGREDLDFIRLDEHAFAQNKNISVDYAVMEKTENSWCIPFDAGWNDLGSWQSLWDCVDKDESGNANFGDVVCVDCKNSLFYSETRLIAGLGLKDIVVVDTGDALLVVDRHQTQKVKTLVDQLAVTDYAKFVEQHRQVHRPWGNYQTIDHGERYQVKRIEVKPGESLSLQMHHHRAEHWVVVSGTALVQQGEKEVLLSENESIYIPLGETHRLTNPGKLTLQLIEVQSGSYLGEDDIVRFEDTYGRP